VQSLSCIFKTKRSKAMLKLYLSKMETHCHFVTFIHIVTMSMISILASKFIGQDVQEICYVRMSLERRKSLCCHPCRIKISITAILCSIFSGVSCSAMYNKAVILLVLKQFPCLGGGLVCQSTLMWHSLSCTP
jgi:hypothetical protein